MLPVLQAPSDASAVLSVVVVCVRLRSGSAEFPGVATASLKPGCFGGLDERNHFILLRRTLPVAAVLIATGSIAWTAAAASHGTDHKITETERIAHVVVRHGPTPGEVHYEYAGTIDGHIGSLITHGALRGTGALNTHSGTHSGIEILRVTEFDELGSRSALIHEFFKTSDGRSTFTGEGKWTEGTDHWSGAHGSFEVTGGRPVDGVAFVRVDGNINY